VVPPGKGVVEEDSAGRNFSFWAQEDLLGEVGLLGPLAAAATSSVRAVFGSTSQPSQPTRVHSKRHSASSPEDFLFGVFVFRAPGDRESLAVQSCSSSDGQEVLGDIITSKSSSNVLEETRGNRASGAICSECCSWATAHEQRGY